MSTHSEHSLRRRDFLGVGTATLGAAWLAACGRDVVAPVLDPLLSRRPPTGARNPLRIPAVASPSGLTLTAASGIADLGGGRLSNALLYNGQFPGPTLVANTGGRVTVQLVNDLAQDSITHWHGMVVDTADDGHPRDAVPPGASYSYDFTIAQRACLNWYHPHPHMHTGEQVYHGLAGAFIVRDAEEAALGLPSGAYEVPLILRDASFDSAGSLKLGAKSSGFLGNEPLANGTRSAMLAVDRAVYRFRILNGCNARVFHIALSNGAPLTLIGNDGGLLPSAVQLTDITLGPAERADLIVDLRALAQGASIMVQCVNAGWNLLELRGTGVAGGGTVPSGALSTIMPLVGPTSPTREFSFEGMTRINGKIYEIGRIDFQVPVNTVERWRFTTKGNAPHPVHVHGAQFQVQARTGGRGQLFAWERGWKDTVLLGDSETVDVLVRFDRTGLYLIHCHQLAHEDQGMMSNFVVV